MKSIELNSSIKESWDKYNEVRIIGDKKGANKLLTGFINSLKQTDEKFIKAFVDEICELLLNTNEIMANNGDDVSAANQRIQHPLFKEIILPVLSSGYKKNSARHIRWIGQLEQFFYSDQIATTLFLKELQIEGNFEARYFFEKSFLLEGNQNTLTLLLNRIAQDINFYVHEVPLGVLIKPEELINELEFFNNYWQQSAIKYLWEKHLEQWKKIAMHWSKYFSIFQNGDSFEDYLEKNNVEFD